jgi:hypothetical protein
MTVCIIVKMAVIILQPCVQIHSVIYSCLFMYVHRYLIVVPSRLKHSAFKYFFQKFFENFRTNYCLVNCAHCKFSRHASTCVPWIVNSAPLLLQHWNDWAEISFGTVGPISRKRECTITACRDIVQHCNNNRRCARRNLRTRRRIHLCMYDQIGQNAWG